ncbi:MAG: tRNA (guanosine(37)-N1)-methyltransferase TrmD [Myxococcota bacterium]
MEIDVVTLFPDFFGAPLSTGLVGKAIESGRAAVRTIDPRAYTQDRHRTVDDTPYGGGGGMVMKPAPMMAAIREGQSRGRGPVVLMSPQGQPLTQAHFRRWSSGDHIVLVAGRYEGFDERIRQRIDEEISLGDFVLTGGEYGVLTIIDGVIRLLPGTLGNKDCPEHDSFEDGLLEYPHYTRPAEFEGTAVPEVLQSGHHQRLTEWRRAQALLRTRVRRPDLLKRRGLRPDEAVWLRAVNTPPVLVAVPASAISEALVSVAIAFGVERIFAVAEDDAQRRAAMASIRSLPEPHYPAYEGPRPRKHRRLPPTMVQPDLRSAVEVVQGWNAVPRVWRDVAVDRLAVERRPPLDAQFRDPSEYGPGPHRSVPCLMFEAPRSEVDAYLPVVRGSELSNRMKMEVVLGVYLDRIIGEG